MINYVCLPWVPMGRLSTHAIYLLYPQHHYPEKKEFVSGFKVTLEKNDLLPLRIPILYFSFGEDAPLYKT